MEHQNICQSCGMPMSKPEEFGTEANGRASQVYCTYCYQNGKFEDENLTLDAMIEQTIPYVVPSEFSDEETARKELQEWLPQLKRWAK